MIKNKGNCVDKFIKNRIDRSLNNILQFRLNIKKRIVKRSNEINYFDSLCYEQDYSQIINIRNEAIKLQENCDKFLERISEQYSKLN